MPSLTQQTVILQSFAADGDVSELEDRIEALEAIINANKPVNSALPAISGNPEPGSTLTASTGTWSNSPTSYTYQWKLEGVNISGATASTYDPLEAQLGLDLTVSVIGINNFGSGAAATSAAVTVEDGEVLFGDTDVLWGSTSVTFAD